MRRSHSGHETAVPASQLQREDRPSRPSSPAQRPLPRFGGKTNTLGSGVVVAFVAACVYALCRRYGTLKVVAALVVSLFGASFLRRLTRMFHHHFGGRPRGGVGGAGILHRRFGASGLADRRAEYPALFIRGPDGRIERASGIAVSLALHQGDFGPDDYEDLLLLDEPDGTVGTGLQHSPGGAPMAAISALLTYTVPKPGQVSNPPFDITGGCSVCLADFEPGDTAKRAPCASHVFHQSCLDPWLKIKNACPVCRAACNDPLSGGAEEKKLS